MCLQKMVQMKEEMDSVKQNMDNLSRKYGEQLAVLAEDISQVQLTITNGIFSYGFFEERNT